MGFWKLVAAIVVGNLLAGLVAGGLWLLFLASLLGGHQVPSAAGTMAESAPVVTNAEELQPEQNAMPTDAYFNIPADAKPENRH